VNTGQRPAARISVVTAAYNSASVLPALIDSLCRQTDQDFEWVVADGASSDGSVSLLQSLGHLKVVISSQPDFGIYDALNRAIRLATGDYYIVAGADDHFHDDAIANFRKAIEQHGSDIVVANAMFGRHCSRIKRAPSWLMGEKSYIAHHSISTAFRKDLHIRFGFYSRKFPIAADSLFVLQACKGGATRGESGFVAGELGSHGVSYLDWVGSATELFRVQLMVGCAMFPQVLLLLLRIVKGSSSGARSLHDAFFR
jgi:glycosyltransferase involved in cell wall biosynthesis